MAKKYIIKKNSKEISYLKTYAQKLKADIMAKNIYSKILKGDITAKDI